MGAETACKAVPAIGRGAHATAKPTSNADPRPGNGDPMPGARTIGLFSLPLHFQIAYSIVLSFVE